jgi:hypothetical protein
MLLELSYPLKAATRCKGRYPYESLQAHAELMCLLHLGGIQKETVTENGVAKKLDTFFRKNQ